MIFPLPVPYFSIIAWVGVRSSLLAVSCSIVGPAKAFFVFWMKESFLGEGVLDFLEDEEALASRTVSAVLVVE